MGAFKYGDLEITVERLRATGVWQEYGMKIQAPGHPLYGFKVWKVGGSKEKVLAEVLIYDLNKAYKRPLDYIQETVRTEAGPRTVTQEEDAVEFARVASELSEFLYRAYRDIYTKRKLDPISGPEAFERGPREWFPGKKE
jgi:hypothetical protein